MPYSTAAWSFQTKRYLVTMTAEPEDMAPDFDDVETIREIERGTYTWFHAVVRVLYRANPRHDWRLIARDDLGGCSYKSVSEFVTSHRDSDPMNRNCSIMRAARGQNVVICHYFPSMVTEAIAVAREYLARRPA